MSSLIIGYQGEKEYFIFSSYFIENKLSEENNEESKNEEEKIKDPDFSYFHIPKPESLRLEERKLRSIKWLED